MRDILERARPICIHTPSLPGCLSEGSGLSVSIKDSPRPGTPVQDKWHHQSRSEQLLPRPLQGSQICVNQINKHVLGNGWSKISGRSFADWLISPSTATEGLFTSDMHVSTCLAARGQRGKQEQAASPHL